MSGSESGPVDESASAFERGEQVLALLLAGLRVSTLVQMVPSALVAVGASPRPGWAVVSWSLAIAMSSAVAVASVLRRRAPDGAWALVDVVVAITVMMIGLVTVPPEHRLGSWVGFQPGYALAVAFALAAVRRPAACAAGVGALAAAQVVYLLPLLDSHGVDVAAAVGNLLTLLVLPAVTWFGAGAVLDLARTADENRALAVAASRAAEARRGRVAVHNAASTIRLLLDLDRPVDDATRRARSSLLAQASEELSRMRLYLRAEQGPARPALAGPETLAVLVERVASEFADLDIVTQADLARELVPVGGLPADLAAALRSLLLNVREHAHATQVVLHAEALDPDGGWRLSVHDDGEGFDVDGVARGAGLADVVVGQLALHGVEVTIESHLGLGTTVHLHRPSRDSAVRVGRDA